MTKLGRSLLVGAPSSRRSFRALAVDSLRKGRVRFLIGAARRSLALRLGHPDSRPLFATLAVTWHCNLRCFQCDFPLRPDRDPSLDELHQRLRGLRRLGALAVGLTGGEPLVRPDLAAVVREARRLRLAVHLNSNGTFTLWERHGPALLAEGLDSVNLSLDGASAATHDTLRGRSGSFADVCRTVEWLRRERLRGTPRIGLVMAISRRNRHEVSALQDLAARLGVDTAGYLPLHAFRDEEAVFDDRERQELEGELARVSGRSDHSRAYLEGIPGFLAGAATPMRCSAPHSHRAVGVDGRVHPCVPLMTLGRAGVPWDAEGDPRPEPSRADREEVCRRCWWNCHRELDLSVGYLRASAGASCGSSPPSP